MSGEWQNNGDREPNDAVARHEGAWGTAPKKNWGLTGTDLTKVFGQDGLEIAELRVRGWTEALIKKYIGDHDWRDDVHHWANFTGKNMYARIRVTMAEAMPEFEADFLASVKRRRLGPEQIEWFRSNRAPD